MFQTNVLSYWRAKLSIFHGSIRLFSAKINTCIPIYFLVREKNRALFLFYRRTATYHNATFSDHISHFRFMA